MNAILNTLLEITVFSAVLYGAILFFQKLFRKHISAVMNYAVWALLILRLIIPVTVDSGLHFFILPDEPKQAAYTAASNINAPPQGYTLTNQPITDNTSSETSINNETNNTTLSSQKQIRQRNIGWQTVSVIIWGAGVLFSIIFLMILWQRLRQKIKRCGTAAPGYVLKLVNKCKSEMGIKADICISVQGWLRSPALSASLKPMLLLPEHMLHTMDLRQLEFGIRHELTHYLRRDYLMNMLLAALRCVYWFNPVIYLAFRSMQADMETACDTRITSRLKSTERTRYIRTMIDIGGSGNMRYMLGMGMSKGGKEMERRVRGIFMRKNTRLPARMAAALLAGLMLVACFTTACRPTPENEIIIGKNGQLEDQIGTSSVPIQEYNIPDSYKMSFESYNSALNVSVDANIDIPDTDKFPVYHITRAFFSQEQADNLISVLIGDIKIYRNVRTRSDIEKELIDMRQLYNDVKNGKYGDIKDFSFYTGRINELEKELAATPEDSNDQESDGKLIASQTGSELNIKADLGKNEPAALKIQNDNENNMSTCFFSNGNEYFADGDMEPAKGVNMTPDEAMGDAQNFLKKAGLNDFNTIYARKGSVYLTGDKKSDSEGYVVTCARRVAGIPVTYNIAAGSDEMSAGLSLENPVFYNPMLNNEKLIMTFDDSGLTTLHWENPIDTEILNENVTIMDFEKIMPLFQQAMINKYSWFNEPEGVEGKITGVSVNIDRITLGFARTPIKDKPGEYMLVPAWDFFGSYTQKYEGREDSTVNNKYISFVTINAIDGSIINLTS